MQTYSSAPMGQPSACNHNLAPVRLLFNALLDSGCTRAEALGTIWPLVLVDGRPDASPSLARMFAGTVAPQLDLCQEEIERALAQPLASKMAAVSCLVSLQAMSGAAL